MYRRRSLRVFVLISAAVAVDLQISVLPVVFSLLFFSVLPVVFRRSGLRVYARLRCGDSVRSYQDYGPCHQLCHMTSSSLPVR